MNEVLVVAGKKVTAKMFSTGILFQGANVGMVLMQVEALGEEQKSCAVRCGGGFCSGWHFFLNED